MRNLPIALLVLFGVMACTTGDQTDDSSADGEEAALSNDPAGCKKFQIKQLSEGNEEVHCTATECKKYVIKQLYEGHEEVHCTASECKKFQIKQLSEGHEEVHCTASECKKYVIKQLYEGHEEVHCPGFGAWGNSEPQPDDED